MKQSRLAVTAIFRFNDKIYHIKRANHLRAFPGYTAFPGGKVDQIDHDDELEATLRNTLKREIKEELQVDIMSLLDQKLIKSIKRIAKATSPSFNPYLFETYFYLIELSEMITFKEDIGEIAESSWLSAEVVLQKFNSGSLLMIYPIRKVFENLSQGDDSFFDFDDERENDLPMIEPKKNLFQIMPKSRTLPPAMRTNAFVIGEEEKTLIDPSPRDKTELSLLKARLELFNITQILITHHHGDHHENAPALARDLNVKILISKDSYERCQKVYGLEYFKNCEVQIIGDGDKVTSWLGSSVRAYSVPGHDEGHIALAPDSMEWFIVGDLFQGVGTVVVGGAEGDMKKYFESLEKVISFNPSCVIPSHGIALGGTNILVKTLEHRRLRESQILDLYELGKTNDEILKTIYFNLPETLLKYAMANIESHLKKLKSENRLSSSKFNR